MAFPTTLYFYFLFLLIPFFSSSLIPPSCDSHDSFALSQFKNSLSLDHSASTGCDEFFDDHYPYNTQYKNSSYPKTASWGNDSNCCLWDGITCDSMSGHVIGLDLSCSWLQGQLHPNSTLFQLSHLQTLNLAFNDFDGSLISPQFGDFPTLMHLNLSTSYFVGEIPLKISHLSKLVSLDLSWNGYDGSNDLRLESSTWKKIILNTTALEELVLDGVNMSHVAPSSFSLLMNLSSSLVYLSLQDTLLQENLADNIFRLQNLQKLDLSNNENFMGQLPNSIGQLKSLNFLSLKDCQFVGHIPKSFENLTQLNYLDLAWNNFNGGLSFLSNLQSLTLLMLDNNSFRGGLPNSMGQLKSLNFLSLRGCKFDGPIPKSFENLTQLNYLDLAWNNFNGGLSFLSNLQSLTLLMLDNNSFRGGLPNSMGQLKSLNFLSLRGCKFDGPIPKSFENLTQLNYLDLAWNNFNDELSFLSNLQSLTLLDLSDNFFSGRLPNVFGNLRKLKFFDISQNNIEGELPSSLCNLTQLIDLSCSSNKLTLFPHGCKLSNLKVLDLSNNKLQGNFLESIFRLINLSSLSLASNNLSGSVNFHQFSKFQNLKELSLSNNKFLSLSSDNNINYTIPNLQFLLLSSCNITFFPKFISLPNLHELYLHDNKLQSLPESIFCFSNLSYLSLSSNNLRGPVSLHQFSKLQNLEALHLSNNKFLSLSSENKVHYTLPNLVSLNLSSCNINDFPKVLGNLPNLTSLDLSNNTIHGNIPKWFNNLVNGSLKYLDLSHDNLTSSVEHLSMRNIESLDLSFNLLEGNLPIPSMGVQFFSVSNNKFSGHICSSFCNASSLVILNLSHNNLSDHIPMCLVALPSLDALDLQMNHFVGTIPDKFSENNSLQSLHLNNNQFEGELPLSLTHCKYLEILDVGANNIKGEFPHWFEGLSELQVLILRDNKFFGAIHSSNNTKHPFPMLRIFEVSNNRFSGSLPTAYIMEFKGMMEIDYVGIGLHYMGDNYLRVSHTYRESVKVTLKGNEVELERILTTFTTIDLSNNMFDGEIPQVIGKLNSLKGLNLSNNKITGSIPRSIANLTNLESLDLSSNRITGEIPHVLANLNSLEVLDLSHNQLVGEIPRGKQFDTFSKNSFEGNLGLCGFQLSKACNQDERKLPQPTSSTDDKFGFGWKPVALGYGCGMMFGMFMGQVVFSIGKPEWLIRIFQARPKKQAKRTRKRTQ